MDGLNLSSCLLSDHQDNKNKAIYDLYAVFNHSSGYYGDYYSYVKCEENKEWNVLRDNNVGKIDDINNIISKTTYIYWFIVNVK